jgi:hypothetical protein
MSDGKISLQFLGEQMLRMQADFRGVRSEQLKLESEQATMQADIAGLRSDVSRIDAKVDNLAIRVDNLTTSMDAQFSQVHQTMATNLEIMLNALDARTGKSDSAE